MSYENFPYSNFHELNADWILEQVRDCVKKVADLGLSFEQLKEYVNNYFSSLDVDSAIAAEIQRLIDNGTMGALINQTLLGEINTKVDNLNSYMDKVYVRDSHILTVGHSNGVMFNSIKAAIDYAISKGLSMTNRYAILVEPGDYHEQLVYNDIHGLAIIGVGNIPNDVQIYFSGGYPDCTVHVQGDVSFYNLQIRNTVTDTYAVHVDVLDTNVSGVVAFRNCRLVGGTAIGYGSGTNTQLRLYDCQLIGNGSRPVLYAHNSPYPNRQGQVLIVNNCCFNHTSGKAVVIDDAGYSNGNVRSIMTVVFSGNYTDYAGYLNIQFRKATGIESTWKSYLPNDDANIRCGTGCANNSGIPGLNVIENHFVQSMVGTAPADSSGKIYVTATFPPHLNGNNYNITVTACNVDGVGHPATTFLNKGESFYQFTIDGVSAGAHTWQVNVEFTVA